MKKFLIVGLMILGGIFIVSCATAPKKTPPATEGGVTPAPEKEYTKAKELRARIAKYGLDRYAPDDFSAAEVKFSEGESAYKKDNERAKAAFNESIRFYQAVISTGFPALIDDKIAAVEQLKMSAEAIKAQVAVKDEYSSAKNAYDKALDQKDKGNYENASDLLDKSKDQFKSVYDITLAKKKRAEESILESRNAIEELESAVQQ